MLHWEERHQFHGSRGSPLFILYVRLLTGLNKLAQQPLWPHLWWHAPLPVLTESWGSGLRSRPRLAERLLPSRPEATCSGRPSGPSAGHWSCPHWPARLTGHAGALASDPPHTLPGPNAPARTARGCVRGCGCVSSRGSLHCLQLPQAGARKSAWMPPSPGPPASSLPPSPMQATCRMALSPMATTQAGPAPLLSTLLPASPPGSPSQGAHHPCWSC